MMNDDDIFDSAIDVDFGFGDFPEPDFYDYLLDPFIFEGDFS